MSIPVPNDRFFIAFASVALSPIAMPVLLYGGVKGAISGFNAACRTDQKCKAFGMSILSGLCFTAIGGLVTGFTCSPIGIFVGGALGSLIVAAIAGGLIVSQKLNHH